jgi:hypothetical protein
VADLKYISEALDETFVIKVLDEIFIIENPTSLYDGGSK